ncbi:MAG TPA: hypothetical protein EYO42_00920 [Candidatus Poseidoniales archaeon]|nr:hypothetical protein [Candidatus Poseidoniales archaeon]
MRRRIMVCAVVLLLSSVLAQSPPHYSDESESLSSQVPSFAMVKMGEMANVTVTHEGGVNYSIEWNIDASVEAGNWGVFDAVQREHLVAGYLIDNVTSANFSLNGTSCSCVYWVNTTWGNDEQYTEFRVEFLGTSPHTPFAVITEWSSLYVRNVLTLQGEVFTAEENETFEARFSLCSSDSYFSGTCATMLDTIFNPMQNPVSVPMQWDWSGNEFSLSLSITDNKDIISDDIYYPYISIRGESLLTSHALSNMVIIDATKPTAKIIGPGEVNEQSGAVILDGSGSDDNMSAIYFSWVITEPSGAVRGPTNNESLGSFLYIVPNQAGVWQFTLSVTDYAGNRNTTTHNMTVTNVVPTAVMYIGGMSAANGTLHRLPEIENWTFSAEHSTDEGDDSEILNYRWLFDGEEVSDDVTYILPNSAISGIHEMILQVSDNDGASDSISIEVVIFGSSADPLAESVESSAFSGMVDKFGIISIALGIIILVLASVFTMWTIGSKRKVEARGIPKWQSGKNN